MALRIDFMCSSFLTRTCGLARTIFFACKCAASAPLMHSVRNAWLALLLIAVSAVAAEEMGASGKVMRRDRLSLHDITPSLFPLAGNRERIHGGVSDRLDGAVALAHRTERRARNEQDDHDLRSEG
jgi:hypothetical protein